MCRIKLKVLNVLLLLLQMIIQSNASWDSSPTGQYHIQTDEGPERYFRYLTDNGQYRKERRLQDGTVIGTDAWIDASGVLRQKDYIADGDGYRILKSKTVFIGKGQQIENALRSLKDSKLNHEKNGDFYQKSAVTTENPLNYNHLTAVTPAHPYYHKSDTPSVFIHPNSQPLNAFSKTQHSSTSIPSYENVRVPSIEFEPPLNDLTVAYPSSTISPNIQDIIRPTAIYAPTRPSPISSTELPIIGSTSVAPLSNDLVPPFFTPKIPSNDFTQYDNFFSEILSTTPKPTPITAEDAVQPLYMRPQIRKMSYSSQHPFSRTTPSELDSNYDSQFPYYDGVSISNNGFRYYLPRHYHEEESIDDENRAGSFGYIDPFGIRRVIYYNTSPKGGFIHKKNNRYVGFDATPYDPRPS